MSTGRQLRHLTRWEFVHARTWVLLFTTVVAAAVYAALAGRWGDEAMLLPWLVLMVGCLGAAQVMLTDPPLDSAAFGVGKPISRGAMVMAKLGVALAVYWLGPLAVVLAVQLAGGVPIREALEGAGASDRLLRPWLMLSLAIGAVSRTMKDVIIGAAAVGTVLLSVGLFVVSGWTGAVALELANSEATRLTLRCIEWSATIAPLVLLVWIHRRRRSALLARGIVAVLILWQWFGTALRVGTADAAVRRADVPSAFRIDSLTVDRDSLLRVAYHVDAQGDTSGYAVDVYRVLAVLRDGSRLDTLPLTAVVAKNEKSPESRHAPGAMQTSTPRVLSFSSNDELLPIRASFTTEGVLVLLLRQRSRAADAVLSVRLPAQRFAVVDSTRTRFQRATLLAREGLILRVQRDSADARGSTTVTMEDRGANRFSYAGQVEPLRFMELRTAGPSGDCCVPLRLYRSWARNVGAVLPGAVRSRTEAPIARGAEPLAMTAMTIREWRPLERVQFKTEQRLSPP